ncbi:MAG: helix-turn-helix transcriptional regulator [Clostridia bacterium]|nr:helix-turn-helix transcriptional regulator [Clostridia bacterium]
MDILGIDGVLKDRIILSEHRLSSPIKWNQPHIHLNYEICMALGCGFTYYINGRLYPMASGDIMLLTNDDYHMTIAPSDKPYERQVISFLPKALPLEKKSLDCLLSCFIRRDEITGRKLTPTETERTEFLQLAQTIEVEEKEAVLGKLGQQLALYRLLLLLNRIWQHMTQKSVLTPSDSYSPQIRIVFDYIEKNYARSISLDELSASCFLNKHYLCRLFHKETGFGIHDCILSYRLSRATMLLREGKSVKDAAWLCGFNSTSYFISTFKKKVGMTPLQYTKRNISVHE